MKILKNLNLSDMQDSNIIEKYKESLKNDFTQEAVNKGFTKEQAEFLFDKCRPNVSSFNLF